jgi:hypothetical protein
VGLTDRDEFTQDGERRSDVNLAARDTRSAEAAERQEMYAESVRRHEENQRRLNAGAWYEYHQGQAERHRATLTALISRHEAQAAKYRENGHYHEKE